MANTTKIFISGRSQVIRLPTEKSQKTWAEIFADFSGDPNFSIHREQLKDKPRKAHF